MKGGKEVMSKCNVGSSDRLVRTIIGLVALVLGVRYNEWWFLVSAVMFLTAIFGWCPLYSLAGKGTCEKKTSGSVEHPVHIAHKKSSKKKRR